MKYDLFQTEREQAEIMSNGLKVRKYIKGNKLCLQIWRPKALKPHIHYWLKSEEIREQYIKKEIDSLDRHNQYVQEYKEKRKPKLEDAKQLKKGDIFYTSWGYDQTNYDFIVVLSVSPTGKTCKCQRTSSLHMGTSGQSNVQEPIFMNFGDIFQLQVRNGYQIGGSVQLVGSYPYCHDGAGSKRHGYFSRHTIGAQYHETMAEFGH